MPVALRFPSPMSIDWAARTGAAPRGPARRVRLYDSPSDAAMASKKDRTSSAAGATSPTAPPAGSPTGAPGAAANGAGGAVGPEVPAEGFNIVAARQAIPVLDRVLRSWDRALGAQHTPAGFAVEFVEHIEPSRLERIRCASLEEIGRLAEELAAAYPVVPATDWRAALSAKRVKPRAGAVHSAGRTPREAKTGTPSGTAGESARRTEGATAASAAGSPPAASAGLTPELRAQHRIPDWADGSDLRPGETLDRYASRKRVAGPPPDRSKFIGE